jgi:membrane-bound lytic murein transglycosylase A
LENTVKIDFMSNAAVARYVGNLNVAFSIMNLRQLSITRRQAVKPVPSRHNGVRSFGTMFLSLLAVGALFLYASRITETDKPRYQLAPSESVTVTAPHLLVAGSTPQTMQQLNRMQSASSLALNDEQLWRRMSNANHRRALLQSVDRSLRYLRTRRAAADYRKLQATTGISRDRAARSLRRFRHSLKTFRTASQFRAALQREFVWYQPAAQPALRSVHFTGYYEPVYTASRTRTATYRYAVYGVPRNFSSWRRPHPTRLALEGEDGLQASNHLRGTELGWLSDRLDAFLLQVQGSGRLKFTDGKTMTVGYGAHTSWPYRSVGQELVRDGKIASTELTLQSLIAYFRAYPDELNSYLPRNPRFVFFRATHGAPVRGSLGVPLTAECSIATDKTKMPPGALSFIHLEFANPYAERVMRSRTLSRFVLHQDAGSAIKGAGRVDIFMGTGKIAGERAGVINSTGQLYYLLLKK